MMSSGKIAARGKRRFSWRDFWLTTMVLPGAIWLLLIRYLPMLGVVIAFKDYKAQKRQGLDPVFVAESIPGLPATECWHETREELPTIDSGIVFGDTED